MSQCFDGALAILVEGMLLRREKKLLAPARRRCIETQNACHQRICFANQLLRRADLRDEPDLERADRTDGLAEKNQRKCGLRRGTP